MLKRASCQASQTLEAEYAEFAALPPENPLRKVGEQMLALLPLLSEVGAKCDVWALTSHARLCLLADDDWESPWFVQIDALSWGGFEVRYLLPPEAAPWPQAAVLGFARDVRMASSMIRTAMARSGGFVEGAFSPFGG
jgi:hypothetical protein